jgi:hypothetical protein
LAGLTESNALLKDVFLLVSLTALPKSTIPIGCFGNALLWPKPRVAAVRNDPDGVLKATRCFEPKQRVAKSSVPIGCLSNTLLSKATRCFGKSNALPQYVMIPMACHTRWFGAPNRAFGFPMKFSEGFSCWCFF